MTDLWAGVVPVSTRLAFVLTGDRERAARIARRTFVRLRARFQDLRDPYTIEMWTRRSVVRQARRVRPPASDGDGSHEARLWNAFLALRRRRRAALALRLLEGMADDQIADVLGCSPSGARSLIDHGLAALEPHAAVPAEVEDEVAALIVARGEKVQSEPYDHPRTARRARLLRAAVVVAAAALGIGLVAGGRVLLESLWGDRDGLSVELAQDDLDGGPAPAEPTDLSPAVTPGWCPPVHRMRSLGPDDRMGASAAARNLGVSLGKGYSISDQVLRARGVPSPSGWPRPQSGRQQILQSAPASTDLLLVDECGGAVADRTWKVVMREFEEIGTNNVFVVYLTKTRGGWKAWATLVGEARS